MKSRRKGGRRPSLGLERLEDRVVLASPAAGYLEGFVFSTPGAVIRVPGHYDATAQQQVLYTDLSGAGSGLPALAAGANGASAVVPLVLNPATLKPVNIGLHVQVGTPGTTPVNAIYHLQTTPRAATFRPAGIAAEVALINSIQQLTAAETTYAQIAAANPAATAAVALAFETDFVRSAALNTLSQIDPLVRGQVPAVFVGTVGSTPVGLTTNSLGLLDSLLFQANKAPNLAISTPSDVASQVTTGAFVQASDATNGFNNVTAAQAVGANDTAASTGLGATVAQVNLAAQIESKAATQVAAALANPANLPASIASVGQVFNDLSTSFTANTAADQADRYSDTIFARPLNTALGASDDYDNQVSNLFDQLFGESPLIPVV